MAEILEFRVPPGNGRTLLVLGLESDELEHALHLAFSAFGLLYSVKINSNATVAGPGYYAFIKFYSARDANKAQQACNGKSLFQKTALKVYMCTRQRALATQTLPLNSYKSQELANYYLGFDGWSSRVITLQNVSGSEDDEKEGGGTLPRHHRSKYLCVQELIIPNYGINTRGFGVAELHVNPGPEFLTASRNAQRSAVQQALSDAFRKILFIIFENGQLAVEYSWAEKDPLDSLTEEELRGRIQITELSFSELDRLGKEEILCTDGE
ncbi:RAD52 motif-containing protein 1 isoform X2 [Ahaetulla prasina]|uniref:RAD52 motif-containing protein 1 isoform X2 n=1 Tax=Ahaetulla prasina TaxID=499056 RepID=UPI00264A0904|nr:RAD52 motif-containing protein 1 isoform X2 [Ahaetulla prasina]